MPARRGEQWNESETWRDAWTLRGAMLIAPAAMAATVVTLIAIRALLPRDSEGG